MYCLQIYRTRSFSARSDTSQLNRIVHHIIQLIKLARKPHIKHLLVLTHERIAPCGQNLCALLEVIDIVHAKEGKTSIRY